MLTRPGAQIFVSEEAALDELKKRAEESKEPYILTAVQLDFNPDKNLAEDPIKKFDVLDKDEPHTLRDFNNVFDMKAIGKFNFATRIGDYWEFMNHGVSTKDKSAVQIIHSPQLPKDFKATVYVLVKKLPWTKED